jgi:hypothetical protein
VARSFLGAKREALRDALVLALTAEPEKEVDGLSYYFQLSDDAEDLLEMVYMPEKKYFVIKN